MGILYGSSLAGTLETGWRGGHCIEVNMPKCRISSYLAKNQEVDRRWYVVDANDQVLGRLATRIATVLMGKHKPQYTPHVDTGDFVVVTNAHRFKLTGNKSKEMIYPRYSFYPGGYKAIPFADVMRDHPERVLQTAVRRMLPKNAMGRHMLTKLKVYTQETHPHTAQRPEPLLENRK